MDWICSSDYSGPALRSVPTGSGVSDQVLGHSGWNWQKDLDSGTREALQVRHHETHCYWYHRFVYGHCDSRCETCFWWNYHVLYICREKRVHQSGGGSQTSRDAAGLLPAGSCAWLVENRNLRHMSPDDTLCSEDFLQNYIFLLISSLLQLSAIVSVYARSATLHLLPSNTTCKILNIRALQSPRWAVDPQTWWGCSVILLFFACKSNK